MPRTSKRTGAAFFRMQRHPFRIAYPLRREFVRFQAPSIVSRRNFRRSNAHQQDNLNPRDDLAQRAAKLKALGAENAFSLYRPTNEKHVEIMEKWFAAGPSPLSEYKLPSGKHEAKRLDKVPGSYHVRSFIPSMERTGKFATHCLVFFEAYKEYMRRDPEEWYDDLDPAKPRELG